MNSTLNSDDYEKRNQSKSPKIERLGEEKRQIVYVVSLTKNGSPHYIFFSLQQIRKMFMIVLSSQARNNNSHNT